MYGSGIDSIGRNGKPERMPIPEPNEDQLLVRVDAVGLCYSDEKLIKQGGKHPKLYNRNLATEPTRLGHEVALTVLRVGEALRDQFYPGQRLALQPDIYQQGASTAYGYTIPGGLTQFHLVGREILDADAGSYVIPVKGKLGYAETALTEPWACVEAAYTQRRRLTPKPDGTMWIIGRPGDASEYEFSNGLDAPATIVITDVPRGTLAGLRKGVGNGGGGKLVEHSGLTTTDYQALGAELTGGAGFDDIVVLDPRSSTIVSEAAKLIARRGTFNLVGSTGLDKPALIDVGRIHYDYTAYLGNPGPDIAASYGEEHNRCELREGGTALIVGAGGPMGQMHLQRAIELARGPELILAAETNPARLAYLKSRFKPLAGERGRRLVTFNPLQEERSLERIVMGETGNNGADDVIVCVPSAEVIAESARAMRPDGMLVLFAGVPNGTTAPLDLSLVYLHSAQYTGTSGSTLGDQRAVIKKALARELSPNQSVAAIGGIEAAKDGIRAMMEGRYPGRVVIFPQLRGLSLIGLSDLKSDLPEIAKYLSSGDTWTIEAEQTLIGRFWTP